MCGGREGGVLQYRFYHHASLVRPTDQETTAVEKIVCYTYRSQEKGPGHTMGWGPHREAPALVRRWGSKEKTQARAFILVSAGGTSEAG